MVFREQQSADLAMNKLQGTNLYDKPMQIAYARKMSDAHADLRGEARQPRAPSFGDEIRKKRAAEEAAAPPRLAQPKQPRASSAPAAPNRCVDSCTL